MKRLLLSMAVAGIAGLSAVAQDHVLNNPNNKAYFGLRVAGEIACPGKMTVDNVSLDCFNNGGGFEIGGIYNIPVVANFYVEPGLKFFRNSYSFKDDWVKDMEDDIIFESMNIWKWGVRLPVMAGYHFDFTDDIKVSVFTGPELEFGFKGKETIKGHNIELSENIYGDDGDMRRVNLMWNVGAGISYQQFYFGIKGGVGMLNMIDEPDVKFHESNVTFSVGYNF